MVKHTNTGISVMKEEVCTHSSRGAWGEHGLILNGVLCEGMSKAG